jgi:hypothetical protein
VRSLLALPAAAVAAAVTAALAVGLAGCATAVNEDGRCQSSFDCAEFNFCDAVGVCRCNDDAACDASEFCNLAGSCQGKLECFTTEDCRTPENPAAICDTRRERSKSDASADDNFLSRTGGQCVTLNATTTQCLMDSHCPFGFFCNSGICQVGCRDNADCVPGDPCINGQCDPTPGACNEPGYCEYGESCGANQRCTPHRLAASLCQPCDSRVCLTGSDCPAGVSCVGATPGSFGTCAGCGNPDIFCLIDASIPATACTEDAQCPIAGSSCKKAQCLRNSDCDVGTCQGGSPGGLFSDPRLGFCSAGRCGAEFCGTDACNDQSDPCPRGYGCGEIRTVFKPCTRGGGQCDGQESCSADFAGENNNAGFCSCDSNADCLDGSTCVNPGPFGSCVAGTSCAPSDGLLCRDLR